MGIPTDEICPLCKKGKLSLTVPDIIGWGYVDPLRGPVIEHALTFSCSGCGYLRKEIHSVPLPRNQSFPSPQRAAGSSAAK